MSNEFCIGPDSEPDKYRLVQQVGSGGEAQLWKAQLDVAGEWEPVAVKVLRPDRTADDWSARWAEQAEVLHFIRHPGVVGVREHFEGSTMHLSGETITADTPRSLYLVMNWVEGPSLREWVPLHREPQHHFDGVKYLAQVGDVLDWLHSGQSTPSNRPIIHADVTPSNVIITESGQAVLVDFGLVRLAGGASGGAVEGTRGYMAPEVLARGEYSAASDRYAFGALTYFVLTGEHPPTDLNAIRAGLSRVSLVANQPDMLDHLMAIFAADPGARPLAGEWIRQFRVSSSTVTAFAGLRPTAPTEQVAATTVIAEEPPKKGGKRALLIAAAIAAVLALAGGAVALMGGGGGGGDAGAADDVTQTTVESATTTTEPGETTTTEPETTTTEPEEASTTTVDPDIQSPDVTAQYLDEMEPVAGSAQTGQVKANAKQYLHGLALYAANGDQNSVEYDISRSWKTLTVNVAARDDNPANTNGAFAIYLDGVKVKEGPIRLGTTTPVKLNVTNALRLKLEITELNDECCSDYYWVFGDPQLSR